MHYIWIIYCALLVGDTTVTHMVRATNLILKKFYRCNPTANYPNMLYMTPRFVDHKQYIDGNITVTVPVSDQLKVSVVVEKVVGQHSLPLIKFEDKHACTCMHKQMGEVIYNIERAAQLVPGLCPIPAGKYHVHDFAVNFNQMPLQTFTPGELRFTVKVEDPRNNQEVTCMKLDFDSAADK